MNIKIFITAPFVLMSACGAQDITTPDPGALTRIVPATDECPAEGVLIEYGLDINGNEQLDDDEVTVSEALCNGQQGSDGADGQNGVDGQDGLPGSDGQDGDTVLVSTADAGEHCPYGGTAVLVGFDEDRDGELDEGEVQETLYVCNGADSPKTLIEMIDEPPGDNCLAGGTRVTSGLDVDGDGYLSEDEIQDTQYVCDPGYTGVLDGDYTINNTIDQDLLVGVTEVTGDLTIYTRAAIELPVLQRVGGKLSLIDVPSVSLPSLQEVGGSMIAPNVRLEELSAPNLATVGDMLQIANTKLTELDFGGLTGVSSVFSITGNLDLSTCLVQDLLNQLSSPPESSFIEGNGACP